MAATLGVAATARAATQHGEHRVTGTTALERLQVSRQLRAALRGTGARLALGTIGSVDIVVYPERPGGRQSTLACLRSRGGSAYVDSAHYRSWRLFSAAVACAVEYLGKMA
ncbi:hypothetical protein LK10_13935 [Sinomonas humi]|uniref:Uncharacterized protein n=1 Tax=Sinomonas humi TaxID=1338436 RepID=A0A0B2AEJ6_9MICC|nr:hypothetical protein LK10_13935 [Sinomonas humi]